MDEVRMCIILASVICLIFGHYGAPYNHEVRVGIPEQPGAAVGVDCNKGQNREKGADE